MNLIFKKILFFFVDQHIPKITLKCTLSFSWFDSQCYDAYRAKVRSHSCKDLNKELNFSTKRKAFKNICNNTMRENDDPNLIIIKFWSHVKSTSKSYRLLECMYRNETYNHF